MDNNKPDGLNLDGSPEERAAAAQVIKQYVSLISPDNEEFEKILKKRRDFFEGRHHLYSNVVGLRGKERQGHILAVFNYVWRMATRVTQALTNSPFRFKIKPEDESDEIESSRAESEENFIDKIFADNHFMDVIFRRNATIQVRDGDFAIKTIVDENFRGEKEIKMQWAENIERLYVVWDDAAGTSYSAVIYRDQWTLEKIAREFNGYKAEAIPDRGGDNVGSSHSDYYGVNSDSAVYDKKAPTGQNKIPKAWVTDTWGWFKVFADDGSGETEWKMCNITMINNDVVQFVKTDYDYNPWVIGHSFDNPGSPRSISFIDNLIDPQVELNDRSSEEGDMIRVGANQKYVVVNMPNFDATSVKPGSGQVIFIEGENADFHALDVNVNPFPTESYINRIKDTLFDLGIPKIALSSGSAPYTGRVGVIQYQPVSDLIEELRIKWSPVLSEVIKRIQSYAHKFFPETKAFMMYRDEETGEEVPVMRKVEFDWDNVLPQSRSDSIVDASTLWDRDLLPFKTMYEMVGFKDPMSQVKQLKKESLDKELMTLKSKFKQFAPGVIDASLEAQQKQRQAEEATGEQMAMAASAAQGQTQPANKPILHNFQNSERRGVPATAGVSGVGQTASAQGAALQVAQNARAAS